MAPDGVQLIEVSPRDGLQNENAVSTGTKVRLVELLVRSGATRIEVVSFAHPRVVPQMADAEAVMQRLPRVEGVSYSGLVLNAVGVRRAVAAGVDEINYVLPVTDSFASANQNTTVERAIGVLEQVQDLAGEFAIPLSVAFAVAFGCPYQGRVEESRVVDVVGEVTQRFALAEVGLADTIGCATPWQIESLFGKVGELTSLPLRAHFHETRHTALANVYAAMRCGVRRFDGSVGGLGGCPFAPGAAGNVATEDLAWMLRNAGFEPGMDVAGAIDAGRFICGAAGVETRSGLAAAGDFPVAAAP
jgi:hydroxymethylglutaryl-CoA lyase